MATVPTLNERALRLADHMAAKAAPLRIDVQTTAAGARILDCGIKRPGGLQAGLALGPRLPRRPGRGRARRRETSPASPARSSRSTTDHPVLACMASQYAGWQISVGKFFAMGSGPMRAAYGKEELFDHIPGREQAPVAVGVLETRKLPDDAVVDHLAERTEPARRTRSRCWSPRPPAWPATCRWWPARWRRPCTSCTS